MCDAIMNITEEQKERALLVLHSTQSGSRSSASPVVRATIFKLEIQPSAVSPAPLRYDVELFRFNFRRIVAKTTVIQRAGVLSPLNLRTSKITSATQIRKLEDTRASGQFICTEARLNAYFADYVKHTVVTSDPI